MSARPPGHTMRLNETAAPGASARRERGQLKRGNRMKDLEGKVAIVTGGATLIGAGVVRALRG